MKKYLFITAVFMVFSLLSCQERVTHLFNGKNLDGWTFYLDPSDPTPADQVFGVKDGMITISGQPFGYMATENRYGNYALHAEWRWVGEPTNSGLFLHIDGPDAIWPHMAEVNLKAGGAGNMISMGGSQFEELAGKGGVFLNSPDPTNVEKPAGEWNEADIICNGNQITVYINGVLKNEAHFDRSEGRIAIQSEGGPLELRNVYIKAVKD